MELAEAGRAMVPRTPPLAERLAERLAELCEGA